jgi:hypothetical protein
MLSCSERVGEFSDCASRVRSPNRNSGWGWAVIRCESVAKLELHSECWARVWVRNKSVAGSRSQWGSDWPPVTARRRADSVRCNWGWRSAVPSGCGSSSVASVPSPGRPDFPRWARCIRCRPSCGPGTDCCAANCPGLEWKSGAASGCSKRSNHVRSNHCSCRRR